MSYVHWDNRPRLSDPFIIAAFSGWNDAGDAATSAVRYLATQWRAREFASIDSEDFYDFSVTRPVIRLHDGVSREIEWPINRLSAAFAPGTPGRDVILLTGVEPQLKWHTFCDTLLDFAKTVGARSILTLGSMLADVAHTRPTPVTAVASSAPLFNYLGLPPAQYEGPTGITSVLQQMASHAGLLAASFWAAVPHYTAQTSSPKATLALVRQVGSVLSTQLDTSDLEQATNAYEAQINEYVGADEELVGYVRDLEEAEDAGANGVDLLAEEVERFLRDHDR